MVGRASLRFRIEQGEQGEAAGVTGVLKFSCFQKLHSYP